MRRQSTNNGTIQNYYFVVLLLHAVVISSRIYYTESWTSPIVPGSSSIVVDDSSLIPQEVSESRKSFLLKSFTATSSILALSISTDTVSAAETVGKDPNCDDLNCIGVWDGLLADCPHSNLFSPGAGCTSSQDDTPGTFSEPWDYSDSPINNSLEYSDQMKLLRPTIEHVCERRGDNCQILLQEDRYLRVSIIDGKSGEKSIAEFYFTQNDATVQFRIASVPSVIGVANSSILSRATSTRNIDRGEMIRKELRYLKIPVLQNRKMALFFVESKFDQFGPGSASLGPPSEMKSADSAEINNSGGGRLSDNVDPKLKIDISQQFPFSTRN